MSKDLRPAAMKTSRTRIGGMRYALSILLKVEHGMTEDEATKQIKADEAKWLKAKKEDESHG
ncbi:hypothetical protein [Streptomyces sp. NPDC055039]